MTNRRLSSTFETKRAAVDDAGTFEGYASVYGGVDSYGDTIAPHAYATTPPSWSSTCAASRPTRHSLTGIPSGSAARAGWP